MDCICSAMYNYNYNFFVILSSMRIINNVCHNWFDHLHPFHHWLATLFTSSSFRYTVSSNCLFAIARTFVSLFSSFHFNSFLRIRTDWITIWNVLKRYSHNNCHDRSILCCFFFVFGCFQQLLPTLFGVCVCVSHLIMNLTNRVVQMNEHEWWRSNFNQKCYTLLLVFFSLLIPISH